MGDSQRTPEPENEQHGLSVQELCDLLDNSTDEEVVRGAIGELRRLIHSPNHEVAFAAMRAILDRSPEEEVRKACEPYVADAIKALVELKDAGDDPEVRKSAAETLRNLGWEAKPSRPHQT